MTVARKITGLFGLMLLVPLFFGCQKQTPPATDRSPAAASIIPLDTILRVHWLGKKNISADTNAAGLMAIWNMPESVKLESQTLDKLAAAPWRFLRGETNASSTNLLRPILDDLMTNESYVEVRRATNSPNVADEMVLAVHLDTDHSSLWETNLATALESLTGIHPTNSPSTHQWTLAKHHAPNLIQFSRAGDWTVVGAGVDHNALFDEVRSNIAGGHAVFSALAPHAWLEANGDAAAILTALRIESGLPDLPKISLALEGANGDVRTSAELIFPKPLGLDLRPWNIPTNLIGGSLLSFTAVRGIQPRLASTKAWNNLQIGPPPNQFYLWSMQGFPMESYFAAPIADASNEVSHLSDALLKRAQPWFATNSGLAVFRRSEKYNGLEWRGLPYMAPFLQSISTAQGQFVFGGFLRPDPLMTTNPLPAGLVEGLMNRTNLVVYNRENTDARVQDYLYIGQFLRLVSETRQLSPGSAGLLWLHALSGKIKSDAITQVAQTAPDHLNFDRQSATGFTALELHLLADWLESPDFPFGLYTFRAPTEKQVPITP